MPDIRYICLSDLHLGEEDSLLTAPGTEPGGIDPLEPSPVLAQLIDCINFIVSKNNVRVTKPTLVLNGDILEMALATTDQAAMVFERFLELAMPAGEEVFKEIIYIPGNHDHHLWEAVREGQYVKYLQKEADEAEIKTPWHTTNLFRRRNVQSDLLNQLSKRVRDGKKAKITVFYPNFGLIREDSKNSKAIIFSHGHFVEEMYLLMSKVKTFLFPTRKQPTQIWDIEAENFAWIDFFWSSLGRSGEIGKHMEAIYERLRDKGERRRFCNYVAKRISTCCCPVWLSQWLWRSFFICMCTGMFEPEKHKINEPLSRKTLKGLQYYLSGPLREQILMEGKALPEQLTFVFGHTHKPFFQGMNFEGYRSKIEVYNSGGWVAESKKPEPMHGASIILADGNFNTVSLRIYNECADYKLQLVKLEALDSGNSLYTKLQEIIEPESDPWQHLSRNISKALKIRAERMKYRLDLSLY